MMANKQNMSCMYADYASAQSADAVYTCASCSGMQSAFNAVIMILDAIIVASIIIFGIVIRSAVLRSLVAGILVASLLVLLVVVMYESYRQA